MRICIIEECETKHHARGFCKKHYRTLKDTRDVNKAYHGMAKSPENTAWSNMKTRCYNKNTGRYHSYGGRGITVCDEWLNSFSKFYQDMGDKPNPKDSLDRIDNNKGYSKENCRWTSDVIQCRNQGIRKDNKTGCKGVNFNKCVNKYEVGISVNKKRIYLGIYNTLNEAIEVRKEAELKYW